MIGVKQFPIKWTISICTIVSVLIVLFVGIRVSDAIFKSQLVLTAQDQVKATQAMGLLTSQHKGFWTRDCDKEFLGKMDLFDANGKPISLCSLNPALAQRKFNEIFSQKSSTLRMTSNNPMNRGNSLKGFDIAAFKQFSSDGSKLKELYEFNDDKFTYSVPVLHKESCINCHGLSENAPASVITRYGKENGFGFETGDLAGVITVEMETPSLFSAFISSFQWFDIFIIFIAVALVPLFVNFYLIKPLVSYNAKLRELVNGKEFGEVDSKAYPINSNNEIVQLFYSGAKLSSTFRIMGDNYNKMREKLRNHEET